MSYYDKLVKLLGRKPIDGSLEYNQKILGLKDAEASARSLFNTLISSPKERNKAVKLGLI
jgi:hypothetical protein